MVAMLPTYATSPLFNAGFLLYYSLLRRGLFVSLGVLGEGKRKRAGGLPIVSRALAIFRLLLFLLGEKVPSSFLDNKGLWGLLSLVGSQSPPLVDVILYLRFIGIPSMSLCRGERLYYYTHLVIMIAERDNTPYNLNSVLLAVIITLTAQYGGSSPNGHSRKRTALLTATFTLQEPVFLNSHTNTVFLQSLKWQAPATDTFFASRGCLLTRVPPSRGVIFTRARESDVESTHQPEIINQS